MKSVGYSQKFQSETEKIRPLVLPYLVSKELVLDIGCGHDKIIPSAIGIDGRHLECVDYVTTTLNELSKEFPNFVGNVDVVYSSHCLEHVKDDIGCLKDWISLLRDDGHLILYLPDDRKYDNASNPEHFQRYEHEKFVSWFLENLPSMSLVESGTDFDHPDKYSFYLVAKKSI